MALSYNLGYQESISVHPTRRQNFAGKVYSNFPNIWEWVICLKPGVLEELRDSKSYGQFFGLTLDSRTIGAKGRRGSSKEFFYPVNLFISFPTRYDGTCFLDTPASSLPAPSSNQESSEPLASEWSWRLSTLDNSDLDVWVIMAS